MTGYYSKRKRSFRALSLAIGLAGSLAGLLLMPCPVRAGDTETIEPEPITWARIDFLRNQVQLLPSGEAEPRRARISDVLNFGDALRTLRRSRAELRFNDDSLARIGERATFQFTPDTRNFQLTNGTVLLLIPPGRGRSTIQTPNAVTGIQGSALFVRYIPETDTTIVGALTDNPNGPMVLFNRDGSEQQALQANEIGVIEGDQITQLYRFDSLLFWQSSGLAEGLDYLNDNVTDESDPLNGVREEIQAAIAKQEPLPSEGEGIIENPASFNRPDPVETTPAGTGPDGTAPSSLDGTPPSGTGSVGDNTDSNSNNGTGANSNLPDTTQPNNGSGNTTGNMPSTGTPPVSVPTTGETSLPSPLTPVIPPSGGSVGSGAELLPEPIKLEYRGTPAEAYLTGTPLPSRPLTESVVSNDATTSPPATSSPSSEPSSSSESNPQPGGNGGAPANNGASSNTPAPVITRETPNPTNATPVAPNNAPVLNPSTSLTPIGRPLTENLPTQTPTVAPDIGATSKPPTEAPTANGTPGNGNPIATPGTVIIPETAIPPSTAVPANIPTVNGPPANGPTINGPMTDIPLEPEIGGTPLEGVLKPTNVPTNPGGNPPSANPPQNGTNSPNPSNPGSGAPAPGGGTTGNGGGNSGGNGGGGRVLL